MLPGCRSSALASIRYQCSGSTVRGTPGWSCVRDADVVLTRVQAPTTPRPRPRYSRQRSAQPHLRTGGDDGAHLGQYAETLSGLGGEPIAYVDESSAEYQAFLESVGLPEPIARVMADSDVAVERGYLLVESGDLATRGDFLMAMDTGPADREADHRTRRDGASDRCRSRRAHLDALVARTQGHLVEVVPPPLPIQRHEASLAQREVGKTQSPGRVPRGASFRRIARAEPCSVGRPTS